MKKRHLVKVASDEGDSSDEFSTYNKAFDQYEAKCKQWVEIVIPSIWDKQVTITLSDLGGEVIHQMVISTTNHHQ